MMTQVQWEDECRARLDINEGERNIVYPDSKNIPTIGIGFNLQRPDARVILAKLGADLSAVLAGAALTDAQVAALFQYSWDPIVSEARASLDPFHFDSMSDARRFVICDLVFNLGDGGWWSFVTARSLIDRACHEFRTNNFDAAHALFGQAADDLEGTQWYKDVGNRARRDVAMLRTSNWVDPNGDGSN